METITRKIQLRVTAPDDLSEKEKKEYKDLIWKKLRGANKLNFDLHQFAVKTLFGIDSLTEIRLNDDQEYAELKNQHLSDKENKDLKKQLEKKENEVKKQVIVDLGGKLYTKNGKERTLGVLLQNFIYNELVNYVKKLPENERYLNTYTITAISNYVYGKYKNDQAEVNKGNKTIANYRITQPIPINIKDPNKQGKGKFWFDKNDDGYNFRFRSLAGELVSLNLYFGRDKSNNRIIVDRIYDNHPDYGFSDSSVQIKDNKIFLLLVAKIPSENKELDPEKTLGVDLGVKCAAYIATNNSVEKKALGEEDFALMKTKNKIEYKKRRTQRNAILNNGGIGRKKKLKKLNEYINK